MSPTRGLGAIDAVRAPEWAALPVYALTQLGDAWFVLGAAILVYWFVDRRGGGFALATVLGALAVTAGLKAAFALPRPPAGLRLVAAAGYGFPSGHAIAATVAWGVLALVLDAGTPRRRFAVAAAAVLLVSLSRVALGVHYAADVLAGVAVGLAYLAAVLRVTDRDPMRAAGVALAVALAALALGGGADAAAALGASGTALVGFRFAGVPATPWRRRRVPVAVGTVALVGVVALLVYDDPMALPLAFGLGAFVVGTALAAPLAID